MTTFQPISREEMLAKHKDDSFWYVLDLSLDPPIVVANPFVDDMEELTYLFQEQEDALHWAHVLSKSPAHQDNKLGIQSDTLESLLKDEEEEFGRYKLVGISHIEALNLFENYKEYLYKPEA